MAQRWLIFAILVTGLTHLATLSLDSTALHWVFKLLPMLFIIVLALRSEPADRSRKYKALVVIGLVFSILGDAFLLNVGDRWFMLGLLSFMVGHLFYIAAMLTRWRISIITMLGIVPIGIYSWFVGSKLYDGIMSGEGQSGLWLPVVIYLSIISVMCWSALLSRNGHAVMGALLFVASDSILAWNKFVGAVPASGLWIMLTYFAAQLLIAGSISSVFTNKRLSKKRIVQQSELI
ncbi:lysoplasmalogenase [Paenibacillus sp. KN14-4R]|uniref:lysoplasmalogenase n=1 Tax=Paenibacillus sp. KN14-4R TaxID=3445773 RepID=UPI003F9F9399